MAGNGVNNGSAFGRANRQAPLTPAQRAELAQIAAAQQEVMRRFQAQQQQNPYLSYLAGTQHLTPRAWSSGDPSTRAQDEGPEPEDTTGLKMLDEFLAKRRLANGNERK